MSATTGTWDEVMYVSGAGAVFTAIASVNVDTTLLAGPNEQPTIPAFFYFNKQGLLRKIRLRSKGVLSCTATPTYTFKWSFSTTSGSATIGTTLAISAAITCASGITNQMWESQLDLTCTAVGTGSGNTTVNVSGWVKSPGGFAAPYEYGMMPSQGALATWTATLDNSLTNYINLSVAPSASSSSNTVQCKHLEMHGEN